MTYLQMLTSFENKKVLFSKSSFSVVPYGVRPNDIGPPAMIM